MNLNLPHDNFPPMIGPLPERWRRMALDLLLQSVAASERQSRIEALEASVQQQPSFFAGLLGAMRGPNLVGTIWVELLAGRSAALWPACLLDGEPTETADRLMQAAVDLARTAGYRVAQALPTTAEQRERFVSAGFERLAELRYMVWTRDRRKQHRSERADISDESSASLTPLTFQEYDSRQEERFRQIVEQTYRDTLDCPALNGVRTVEEVLAGYRGGGPLNSAHWLIVRHGDQDVGCLILTDHAAYDQCELVYMGLVAKARGQGWGRIIVRQAQRQTEQAGRARLTLSVDAANEPARQMYASCGFVEWDCRDVYLLLL